MKLLIGNDVMVDYLMQSGEMIEDVLQIFWLHSNEYVQCYKLITSASDIFTRLVERTNDFKEGRAIMSAFLDAVYTEPVSGYHIAQAAKLGWTDFDAAIQYAVAVDMSASYIITSEYYRFSDGDQLNGIEILTPKHFTRKHPLTSFGNKVSSLDVF